MATESPAFDSRRKAGQALAKELTEYRRRADAIVLAIAKEGIEVAQGLAEELAIALDLVLSRRLLVPGESEVTFGAVTSGVMTLDETLIVKWEITKETTHRLARESNAQAREELARLRGKRGPLDLTNKTAIITDDGKSLGFPIISAILWCKRVNAESIIIALPVGPLFTVQSLGAIVDDIVCLETPETRSIDAATYYKKPFDLSDDKIRSLLASRTG